MISCRPISDLAYFQCHTRVYFRFEGDLRIFTEVTCATIEDFTSFVLRTCCAPDATLGHIFHFIWDLWFFIDIACSMIDDFMTPDLRPIIRSMPYWGILPFWMRFTDLGGVACLSPFARCVSRHWSICCFYDDSSVGPLGSCLVRPALLYASMSSCFPSERRPSDLWVWFSCIHRWLRSCIRWWVIWAHLVFLTCHTFDATPGHIPPFRSRLVDSPLICMTTLGFEIHIGLMIWFHYVLILRGAFLDSFSRIRISWYSRDSWTELP